MTIGSEACMPMGFTGIMAVAWPVAVTVERDLAESWPKRCVYLDFTTPYRLECKRTGIKCVDSSVFNDECVDVRVGHLLK